MERFELPRLDWYDEEGRIYKDALIENFNALETKLNEINELSAFSTSIPDISNLSLDDVTLSDDDNKVVNLRSFLTIFNLINYPIELTFNGTNIKRLAYWNNNFTYVEKANVITNANNENKFIIYNFSNDTVRVASTIDTLAEGEKLIGCYIDGRVISPNTAFFSRLNLMYLLGNMPKGSLGRSFGKESVNAYFPKGSQGSQQAAWAGSESSGDYKLGYMKFRQEGRIN